MDIDRILDIEKYISDNIATNYINQKQTGEVFTPYEIINHMLNKLEETNKDIFTDKNNKFLVIDFNRSKIKEVNQSDNFFDLYTIYNHLLDFYKNEKEICLYIKDILLEYIDLNEIDFSHTHHNYCL